MWIFFLKIFTLDWISGHFCFLLFFKKQQNYSKGILLWNKQWLIWPSVAWSTFWKENLYNCTSIEGEEGGVEEAQVPSKLCLSQHIQISEFFQQRNWEKFGKIMCKLFLVKIWLTLLVDWKISPKFLLHYCKFGKNKKTKKHHPDSLFF
jgi:hypothetical protein